MPGLISVPNPGKSFNEKSKKICPMLLSPSSQKFLSFHIRKNRKINPRDKKSKEFLTWRVSLDITHLYESVCGLLDIVVAVRQHVQEQVLLDGRENALQIPRKKKKRILKMKHKEKNIEITFIVFTRILILKMMR